MGSHGTRNTTPASCRELTASIVQQYLPALVPGLQAASPVPHQNFTQGTLSNSNAHILTMMGQTGAAPVSQSIPWQSHQQFSSDFANDGCSRCCRRSAYATCAATLWSSCPTTPRNMVRHMPEHHSQRLLEKQTKNSCNSALAPNVESVKSSVPLGSQGRPIDLCLQLDQVDLH